MPFNIKEYHPKWKLIRKLIKVKRAQNKCECCGVEHNSYVLVGSFRPAPIDKINLLNSLLISGVTIFTARKISGVAKVVLSVAHLDQNIENNRFSNLKAMCQRCHLNHDKADNWNRRRYGKNYKEVHQDLFGQRNPLPHADLATIGSGQHTDCVEAHNHCEKVAAMFFVN
jgi:hypothetical protein